MSGHHSTPNNSDWIRLNVGGKVFQTTKDTLSRCPGSFLARLVNGELPSEKDDSGAYLVDGDPEHFRTILTYLRRGVLNLDGNEKTTKDLLSEADFYNIQPLVDEIRKSMRWVMVDETQKAMCPGINRVETIMLMVEYHKKLRTGSIIVCSEENDDYEVLQALRHIFSCVAKNGKYILQREGQTLTGASQISFEVILRKFGFVQESYDDNYDEGDEKKWKCWKFVRTVSK